MSPIHATNAACRWLLCVALVAMAGTSLLALPQVAVAADANALLKRGLKNYKELEFAKARDAFEAFLQKPKIAKTDKVKALRHLVICYYNEGQKSQAKDVWRQTLKLDRSAKIPPGQAPDVQAFFASVKPPPLPRRSVPIPRRKSTSPPAPSKAGFRHTASIITLGIGVAAAGAAIAFGVMAQGSANQAAQQNNVTDAIQEQNAAQTNATVATGLWIGSGAILATGVVILIIEATRKPAPPKTASIPSNTTNRATTLLQQQ